MYTKTNALLHSLKTAPLLAGNLPSAPVFDRALLGKPAPHTTLNFDQKLGHLYEQALQELINASPDLTCLASHLQIFDNNKRTLGELDYVLFDHVNNQYIHLELAVKFYMATKQVGGWVYPGPNATDNWHRKLNHMQKHQFRLSQHPEAIALLHERFNIKTIAVQQLIYGCLFHPIDQSPAPTPEGIAPTSRTGQWLRVNQWDTYFSNVAEALVIPKPLWPVELTTTKQLLKPTSAAALIKASKTRCTLFTLTHSTTPYFLVPDDWNKLGSENNIMSIEL